MADLLQKVFLVFVRPYYEDNNGAQSFYKEDLWTYRDDATVYQYYREYQLKTNNLTGETLSPVVLNASGRYIADPWMLHSSFTSYENFRQELKKIIAFYGTDNVRCATYLPIDFDVLPRE